MNRNSIRIFIADDNCLLLEGLTSMLSQLDDIDVIGTAPNGLKAIEDIRNLKPDVALIDIGMPDKDGLEVTQILHKDQPGTRVIVLGLADLTEEIMACIESGASGYVLKESSYDHLVDVIQSVYRNETFCSARMAASLFSRIAELTIESKTEIPDHAIKLTARELEIIHLIADGLPNKEIAQRLYIETQTVKNHIHNILDKLQLHSRFEAVQYARDKKLLKNKP